MPPEISLNQWLLSFQCEYESSGGLLKMQIIEYRTNKLPQGSSDHVCITKAQVLPAKAVL